MSTTPVTVEQAQKLRDDLSRNIFNLLSNCTAETGLVVEAIRLRQRMSIGPVDYVVGVEVKL